MEFEKQISKIENDYENLEQYNRRDNLELHGVPQTAQENTNQVIIQVLASGNYKLDEKYISCFHRLPTRGKIPPIIVKFNHRVKAAAHRQAHASAMGNPQSSSDQRLRY